MKEGWSPENPGETQNNKHDLPNTNKINHVWTKIHEQITKMWELEGKSGQQSDVIFCILLRIYGLSLVCSPKPTALPLPFSLTHFNNGEN